MSGRYSHGRGVGHYGHDQDSDDTNPNDSWNQEHEEESSDQKEYASDSNDEPIRRPKRIRKKGRQAKFNVEQMLFDQQMMASNPRIIPQQAMYMGYPNQPTQYYFSQNPPPQVSTPIIQSSQTSQIPPQSLTYPRMVRTQVLDESSFTSHPNLETIKPGYIPGAFDIIPRGPGSNRHPN